MTDKMIPFKDRQQLAYDFSPKPWTIHIWVYLNGNERVETLRVTAATRPSAMVEAEKTYAIYKRHGWVGAYRVLVACKGWEEKQ